MSRRRGKRSFDSSRQRARFCQGTYLLQSNPRPLSVSFLFCTSESKLGYTIHTLPVAKNMTGILERVQNTLY